ncbi:MAG: response regulator [Candidatus Obscuribacterales bacterium]
MTSQVLVLFESDEGSRPVVECLSLAGYFVIVSRNYSAAMAIVQSQPVDLIISDVHLENGGSVFDFLSWIRQNPSTKKTPFVLFSLEPTAMAQVVEHGVRIAARALKASKFISMQVFDGEEFRQQIDSLLSLDNQLKQLKTLKQRESNHDS